MLPLKMAGEYAKKAMGKNEEAATEIDVESSND